MNFRFDEKSLRKLDSDLESLRHYDFRFKLDKNYKINTRPKCYNHLLASTKDLSLGDESQNKCSQPIKLPTIVELQQNNLKTLAQISMSSPAINIGTPRNTSLEGNISKLLSNSNILNKSIKSSNRPIDIDSFIRRKNMQILNKPWNINKSLMVPKSAEKLVSINQEATQFLINKLKDFLKDKYDIETDNDMVNSYNSFNSLNTMQISKQPTPGTTTINDLMTNSLNMSSNNVFPSNIKSSKSELVSFAEPSRIRSSQLSIYKPTKESATDLTNNSIYLKKFKNNYYDRKLWFTLLNNSTVDDNITTRATTNIKSFNFYADNSVRDYNNEFDILNKFDSDSQKRSIFSRSMLLIFLFKYVLFLNDFYLSFDVKL